MAALDNASALYSPQAAGQGRRVEMEGMEGLRLDPRFTTQSDRIVNRQALDRLLSDAFQTKTGRNG